MPKILLKIIIIMPSREASEKMLSPFKVFCRTAEAAVFPRKSYDKVCRVVVVIIIII